MIVDSIENGPYVRRMIATSGEPDLPVLVPETFHEQTGEAFLKMYIREREKKANLFNEWEKFTSTDGESIESYYHCFMQLMNDLKRNKHFPENIEANLKFLKNLQPEWKRHVIINSYNFLATHNAQSSSSTHLQQSFPINNKYNPQPSLNQNFMQPPMTSLKDINVPTEAMNAALILFAKALQLTTPTNNNQRTSSNPRNRQIAQPGMNMSQDRNIQNIGSGTKSARVQCMAEWWDLSCSECNSESGCSEWNCIARPKRTDAAYLQTQLLIAQKKEPRIQLQAEEFNFMAAAGDLDEIDGGIVETSYAPNEETCAHQETVYCNLIDQVAQKMALGYPKPLYLKQAQLKQHGLYNANLLLEEHDPPAVYDLEETLELAQETKFVRDFKSLANEADESLDKQKSLELEIERLLKASVSHDIMSIMQNGFVDVPSDLQTELDPYNDMQQKIERLQAQLGDPKGKSGDTSSASNTLDPLNQKLDTKIVELEFQVVNYERKIRHLKTTYKNLFDSITSNRAHAKLHNLIYENAKLRARLFENTTESMNNTSGISVTPQVDKPKLIAVTPYSKKLHASIPSHSVPQPREFNFVKHSNEISPGMFKIDPSQTSRVDMVPNNQSSASIRTNLITNFQRHVTCKENVSSDTVNSSSTRILSLSKNQKIMSSERNNIKLAIRNDKSKIVCGTCKQCFVTANHDACLNYFVNALNSRANNLCANVPPSANQKRPRIHVWKPKQVGFKERLAWTPKPRLPRFSLKWSPSGRSFDLKGKLVASKETNYSNDDKACPSNPQEPIRKRFPNSTVFLGRLSKFVCGASTRNDHIAEILGYGDLKWGNITIIGVYFVEESGRLDEHLEINEMKLRIAKIKVMNNQQQPTLSKTRRGYLYYLKASHGGLIMGSSWHWA
nr:hypothetical protein [Tanacetum cinerariifolium]